MWQLRAMLLLSVPIQWHLPLSLCSAELCTIPWELTLTGPQAQSLSVPGLSFQVRKQSKGEPLCSSVCQSERRDADWFCVFYSLYYFRSLCLQNLGERTRPYESERVNRSVLSNSVTSWTLAHQGPLSMESSRQKYWSGLPLSSPGDLPNLGIEPRSPSLQADSLPSEGPYGLGLNSELTTQYITGLEKLSKTFWASFLKWGK